MHFNFVSYEILHGSLLFQAQAVMYQMYLFEGSVWYTLGGNSKTVSTCYLLCTWKYILSDPSHKVYTHQGIKYCSESHTSIDRNSSWRSSKKYILDQKTYHRHLVQDYMMLEWRTPCITYKQWHTGEKHSARFQSLGKYTGEINWHRLLVPWWNFIHGLNCFYLQMFKKSFVSLSSQISAFHLILNSFLLCC